MSLSILAATVGFTTVVVVLSQAIFSAMQKETPN